MAQRTQKRRFPPFLRPLENKRLFGIGLLLEVLAERDDRIKVKPRLTHIPHGGKCWP